MLVDPSFTVGLPFILQLVILGHDSTVRFIISFIVLTILAGFPGQLKLTLYVISLSDVGTILSVTDPEGNPLPVKPLNPAVDNEHDCNPTLSFIDQSAETRSPVLSVNRLGLSVY